MFDSPWKEAIEGYFEDFVAFFFPHIHAEIDWSRGYTFLETELQQITRDSELGRRLADKLVQVYTKQGKAAWVFVHIEVQAQEETTFEYRMYIYNTRIFDHYEQEVISLAILGDENPHWRPGTYHRGQWGCNLTFAFPSVKLLDYRERWEELEQSRNPFATIVMAHLKAQETRHDPQQRGQWKFLLVRRLYELGYDRQQILNLFRVIDWLMGLPKEEEVRFRQELKTYEEAHKMPYVTSIERMGREEGLQKGIEQGLQQGLLEGIALALELKYGAEHPLLPRVLEELRQHADVERLQAIQRAIRTVPTLEALWEEYAPDATASET
jgi:predicted transposase YdaD